MKGMRKTLIIISAVLSFALLLSACGGTAVKPADTVKADASTQAPAQETKQEAPKEAVKIKFYAKIVEFTSAEPMIKSLQDHFKDQYVIEPIQVDWANLEKVVKTGIASGDPADIYQFWPQNMKSFVDAKQALDLTPYLEANGGKWKNTFSQGLLDMGKYDGKYYGVPLSANFSLFYVNTDLFDKAGIKVPEKWTWDEFVAACKTIKEKTGVFPFAVGKDLQNWLARNGNLSLAKSAGKLEDMAAGKVEGTDPIFATTMKNIKALYDAQYWYPGKGALTISRDEVRAAFNQGKIAMMAEVASEVKKIVDAAKAANVKIASTSWPSMGKDSAVLGGCDGLFVPANGKHTEDAVKILQYWLGADLQKIHAAEGFATANAKVEVSDPVTKGIVALAGDVYPKEFYNFGPKITDYYDKTLIAEYILGKSDKDVLANIEKLRQDSLKK